MHNPPAKKSPQKYTKENNQEIYDLFQPPEKTD